MTRPLIAAALLAAVIIGGFALGAESLVVPW